MTKLCMEKAKNIVNNKDVIHRVTLKIVQRTIEAFGNDVNRIILYGSCARGDFTPESDIDMMIILDCNRDYLSAYRDRVSQISSDISLDDDVEVSIVLEDVFTFEKWLNTVAFYQNVKNEGVVLYG